MVRCSVTGLPTTQSTWQHMPQSPIQTHTHTVMAVATIQGSDLLSIQKTPQYFYAEAFAHSHKWNSHWEQLGVQYLSQGHQDMLLQQPAVWSMDEPLYLLSNTATQMLYKKVKSKSCILLEKKLSLWSHLTTLGGQMITVVLKGHSGRWKAGPHRERRDVILFTCRNKADRCQTLCVSLSSEMFSSFALFVSYCGKYEEWLLKGLLI